MYDSWCWIYLIDYFHYEKLLSYIFMWKLLTFTKTNIVINKFIKIIKKRCCDVKYKYENFLSHLWIYNLTKFISKWYNITLIVYLDYLFMSKKYFLNIIKYIKNYVKYLNHQNHDLKY